MALTYDELCERIDGIHLDEPDLVITWDGGGFAVEENRGGEHPVSDIGSSWEVPETVGDGRLLFKAGPWTAFQYHASHAAPLRSNYDLDLGDLMDGRVSRVIVGCTAHPENNTWIFGIQTEA